MKLFFSEFKANYDKYYFPYQVWLVKEEGDDENKIYEVGFLPVRNKPNLYYLSRSLRVDLRNFTPSSENRRVLNKTENFKAQLLKLGDFQYTPYVQKFCKEYMDQRFGKDTISVVGIKNIFTKGVYTHVFVWNQEGKETPVGYAVCFINDNLLHYAHAFYDLTQVESHVGIRMILESVIWAKEQGLQFAYLGTVYNSSAYSYKTEFEGVEFFNGFSWTKNLNQLKDLINREGEAYLLRDREFVEKYYQEDLFEILHKEGIRVRF